MQKHQLQNHPQKVQPKPTGREPQSAAADKTETLCQWYSEHRTALAQNYGVDIACVLYRENNSNYVLPGAVEQDPCTLYALNEEKLEAATIVLLIARLGQELPHYLSKD